MLVVPDVDACPLRVIFPMLLVMFRVTPGTASPDMSIEKDS